MGMVIGVINIHVFSDWTKRSDLCNYLRWNLIMPPRRQSLVLEKKKKENEVNTEGIQMIALEIAEKYKLSLYSLLFFMSVF